MSIDRWGVRLRRWHIKASSRKLDHGNHLFVGQMKPFHDLVDGGSGFQIVKDN
jgi:hypothetical protein